ncbi:gamma-glutamyltransferase 1 [Nitzschia inconspicua]|uniref:Gamma-glutamyltransferase 1 n=1 Tax=Nitzschia inconspicua TaxID=303405 RepID=A0A9K3KSN8_9STRA|nr:gamma-glutamyltransferase 1 [Nitzschia inconspicua]
MASIDQSLGAGITSFPTTLPTENNDESCEIQSPISVKTEDTPLTPEGRRRQGFTRRSFVAAESLFHAMVTRAFSIAGADHNDYDPAAMEDTDNDDAENNGHPTEDNDDDDEYFGKRRDGPSLCRGRSACCIVSSLILLGVSVTVGVMMATHETSSWSIPPYSSSNGSCAADKYSVLSLKESSSVEGLKHGAVASDHPVCSQVGSDILQQGGNAVDAAVATVLCLGVANPASSGLGGGAFMLIHSSRENFERKDPATFPEFIDARDISLADEQGTFMTEVVDCRETAPEKSSTDMYRELPNTASAIGPLAIAVPGELRGMELAHARHGKLPWKDVVEPARELAQNGIPVGEHLASDIKGVVTKFPKYGDFPALQRHLTHSGSSETYLKEGELLKNPSLAETLRQVAEQGADALYTGANAEKIVQEIQDAGGILTIRDMGGYKATLRSPVHADVSGFTVVGVPPPSSGGAVVIGAARFLAGYKTPLAATADSLSMHRIVEAMRHAFSIRMSLSDPLYNTGVNNDAVADLTAGDYMESLRRITKDNSTLGLSQYGGEKWAQLNDDDTMKEAQDAHEGDRRRDLLRQRRLARPFGYLDDSGTSHLSVVDKDGNAVAVTSSINGIFGSWIFSEATGVLLGNTMDDFGVPGRSNFYGLKPSEANFILPGKKPLSSMSPTMVFRRQEGKYAAETMGWGDLVLTLGGSGGPKIITAVLQVLLNVCFLGMPLFEAMARPRVHDQLVYHDAVVTGTEKDVLEQGPTLAVSQRTKGSLIQRGHSLLDIDYTGCVQAVSVDLDTKTLSAVSDIRKGGSPAGY